MAKTIAEWLKILPEPYRSDAINNMLLKNATLKASSLKIAITAAFDWTQSPEGHNHWQTLRDTQADDIQKEYEERN